MGPMAGGKKMSRVEREVAYREAFLAGLSARLAAPTSEWPTVRWWTKHSLSRLFREVQDALAEDGLSSDLSHQSLREWLRRLGLEQSVEADGETFHVIEIGAPGGVNPDPLE